MKKLIYSQEDLDLILSLEIQEKEEQITQLTNNWNELEEWENSDDERVKGKCDMARDILYDMEEIKGGNKE